jgi:ADP-ribose pyrophosphatase YjhB (NUDIX family)
MLVHDDYPRPFVTVDIAVFSLREERLHVLLVRRDADPFAGAWALPGGYIHPQEDASLHDAAARILKQKTGVETPYLEQLQGFGDATRDPRGWAATFVYFALIRSDETVLAKGGNASEVLWRRVGNTGSAPLAFDHGVILDAAIRRLRARAAYSLLPVHLLPQKFTLTDLQKLYEQILGRPLEKAAFRKRMHELDGLAPVEGEMRHASHRPAQLYRLDPAKASVFMEKPL